MVSGGGVSGAGATASADGAGAGATDSVWVRSPHAARALGATPSIVAETICFQRTLAVIIITVHGAPATPFCNTRSPTLSLTLNVRRTRERAISFPNE